MKRVGLTALAIVLLPLPLAWMLPLGDWLGSELCLWESLPLALTLFLYYLAYGTGVSRVRRRSRPGDRSFLGILLYFNLPLTAVTVYQNTAWAAPFDCIAG